jgi:hypothetical protein
MVPSGWEGRTLALTPALRGAQGGEKLREEARWADLLILAFPLYVDTLPHLATRALEVLRGEDLRGKALAAVVNCGFPEASQNVVAANVCARFAADAGMVWAGGLALGGGEALFGGEAIGGPRSPGRPPVAHVVRGLDLAAASLAEGGPVPREAAALLARIPIPFMPPWAWRRFFGFMGGLGWKRMAAKGADLRATPLAPAR